VVLRQSHPWSSCPGVLSGISFIVTKGGVVFIKFFQIRCIVSSVEIGISVRLVVRLDLIIRIVRGIVVFGYK
jgi:hypothetical protein